MKKIDLNELFEEESIQLHKLSNLVKQNIAEEEMLSTKLLEVERDDQFTFGERLADKLASFGGSWSFILFFGFFIVCWIFLNLYWLHNRGFDPYPFILLNLILSCLASLQAPIIMMSQNRKEDKDRRRLKSDYMINLKAEMELRGLHQKMDLMIAEQMQSLFKIQKEQLKLLLEINESFQNKHK
jgi:uncharacterized membrane protein